LNQSLNWKAEMRKDRRARIKVFLQILKIRLREGLF
jgi:predicted transcriptional regulator